MQVVTVKLNRLEYRMLYHHLHNTSNTFEAIANTAVELTHSLTGKNVLVATPRDACLTLLSKYRAGNLTEQDHLSAYKAKPFDLTDVNLIKLQELMGRYILNKTDAMCYCLRTLEEYVNRNGFDIIDRYQPEARVSQYKVKKTVKLKLTEDVIAWYMIEGSKLGISSEELMSRTLIEKVQT